MRYAVTVLCLGLLLVGCGSNQRPVEVSETRTVAMPPPMDADHTGHACPMGSTDAVEMPANHPPLSAYLWDLPEGWKEAPPTPMRAGNFTVEASPEIECYLTVLTGMAGGVRANVNRWRHQMGQPEMDADQIAALPTIEMLGHPSTLIEITGDFTGMIGQQESNYMMLAVICALHEETVFVKMTGPVAAVEAERESFLAFCQSLKHEGDTPNASAE